MNQLLKIYWKITNGVNWFLIKTRLNSSNKIIKLLSNILLKFLNGRNFYIGGNAKIHGEPSFPHGLNGIYISNNAVIGKGVKIYHQVTIGSNNIKESKGFGAPTIGDNCYISVGVKIIGNVKVGENVNIGANSVVTKDIPDNCTVVGIPAKIIKQNGLRVDTNLMN